MGSVRSIEAVEHKIVKVEISGNNVSLSPVDATKSVVVFLNNRFEVIEPAVFTFVGTRPARSRA
jgi:hypothetical protein